MKKKFRVAIAAVLCLVACVFCLAACEDTHTTDTVGHVHDYKWIDNGDGTHKQHCAADGCDAPDINAGAHDYGDGGVCVCGKTKPVSEHVHKWSESYTQDGDRHYRTCDGCDEKQYGDHDFTGGACVCGKTPTAGLEYILGEDGESYWAFGSGEVQATDIVIASEYNGKPVTAVGGFENWHANIESVFIPNGVTEIGEYAFAAHMKLESVSIPDSVKTVGEAAFYECENLKYNEYEDGLYLGNSSNPYVALMQMKDDRALSAVVHENAKAVLTNAFYDLRDMESISVGENSTAFAACDGILYNKAKTEIVYVPKNVKGNITIPDGVTKIPFSVNNDLFYRRTSLTGITIPGSVTEMEMGCFLGCTSIESMTLPFAVPSAVGTGNKCFGYLFNDERDPQNNAKVPASMRTVVIIGDRDIGPGAFSGCAQITSITILGTPNKIENNAFLGCSSITSLVIPEGVTKLGNQVFWSCSSLSSLSLPKSLMYIGNLMFPAQLTELTYAGTVDQWNSLMSSNQMSYGIKVNCLDGVKE